MLCKIPPRPSINARSLLLWDRNNSRLHVSSSGPAQQPSERLLEGSIYIWDLSKKNQHLGLALRTFCSVWFFLFSYVFLHRFTGFFSFCLLFPSPLLFFKYMSTFCNTSQISFVYRWTFLDACWTVFKFMLNIYSNTCHTLVKCTFEHFLIHSEHFSRMALTFL